MDTIDGYTAEFSAARERLVAELREHALVIGQVTLTSGAVAQYYVDAKRAILRPEGFAALAALVAAQVSRWEATAVGGMTMGADPVACAALAGGADTKAFFVRKDAKAHGLQRRIEGPLLGPEDRCVVVEDVVTTGGSTLAAIAAVQEAGHQICGVISVLDRLAGGGEAIDRAQGAPYLALSTIDEVYPERPDPPWLRDAVDGHGGGGLRLRARGARRGRAAAARAVPGARRVRAPRGRSCSDRGAAGRGAVRGAPGGAGADRGTRPQPAGYALFFPTFSTFLSRRGVWLEDLFVRPEHRGAGVGRALLAAVAARAARARRRRLEWTALRWNELALGFYRGLGTETMDEWITHRLVGEPLRAGSPRGPPRSGGERR